jgi:hypothetical protein
MENGHIVQLVPARVAADIIPHIITAPAVIDGKFIEVKAPVTDTFFTEYLFDEVDHVSGIVCPVIAPIPQYSCSVRCSPDNSFLFTVNKTRAYSADAESCPHLPFHGQRSSTSILNLFKHFYEKFTFLPSPVQKDETLN